MKPALAAIVLAVSCAARAVTPSGGETGDERHEQWNAGTNHRAPQTLAASLGHSGVFGKTVLGFTTLDVGVPLTGNQRFGTGLYARLGVVELWVPAENRGRVLPQR